MKINQKYYDTLKQFFTDPVLKKPVNDVLMYARVKDTPLVSYTEDGYIYRIGPDGVCVFIAPEEDAEGDVPLELIGSMGRLDNLIVDKAHWGKGIDVKMIVYWFINNKPKKVREKPMRSAYGKASYIKAWSQIEPTLEVVSKP